MQEFSPAKHEFPKIYYAISQIKAILVIAQDGAGNGHQTKNGVYTAGMVLSQLQVCGRPKLRKNRWDTAPLLLFLLFK